MQIKYKPIGDQIVVKLLDAGDETTSSGIILTEHTKTHHKGKVITVGAGLYTQNGVKIPMTVSVNDIVLFHAGGGTKLKIDGEDYLLFRESDLFMYGTE